MSLKEIWKKNVDDYAKDSLFRHRFAVFSEEEGKEWVDALYRNEIVFKSSGKSFRIPDFSKMDFRGPESDHPEWVAQLNRFRWITYAAREFEKTRSDHMAGIFHDSITAWMNYWPYYGDRTDIYPFRGHEFWDPMSSTPIRLGFNKGCGWVGCMPLFFDHPLFTDDFIEEVYESILWQIKPMVYNNREKGGEHNWRPNELDSLLFLSNVLPGAKKYLDYAISNLNDTFRAQFEEDGSHIEHTPDYHGWITEVFALIYFISEKRPELGLEIDGKTLIKAMDYAIESRAPDGRSFGIHDSWPWHPDNPPVDDRIETMRKEITGEKKVISGDSGFPDAGQYFFRNKDNNTMFFFDAARWGSWHCHLSRNSVNMFHEGKMLLIDPGSLDYGKNPVRSYGKFSTSHNTVTINGLSQCPYANPEILEEILNEDTALVVSSYQGGYQSMEGNEKPLTAEHERIFIWVRDRFALVFDNINIYNNQNINKIACHWQLPEGKVLHDRENGSVNTLFDESNVHVQNIYSSPEAGTFIHEGETKPLLGYVSRTGGKLSGAKPAPMFSTEVETDAEFTRFCHLMVPYKQRVPSIETSYDSTRYAMKFNISLDGEVFEVASHYFQREYFKTNSAIRKIGDIETFARVYIKERRTERKPLRGVTGR